MLQLLLECSPSLNRKKIADDTRISLFLSFRYNPPLTAWKEQFHEPVKDYLQERELGLIKLE